MARITFLGKGGPEMIFW